MVIKNEFSIIVMALLLLACGNRSRQELSETDVETVNERWQTGDMTDSVKDGAKAQKAVEPVSSGSYSSSTKGNDDYGNMRGFDPASEDDMDDNGMSRYMENNDDEGWE